MSETNGNKVAQVLAFLAALYPNFKLTKATLTAYSQILEDIPADLLQAAAKDVGSRSTFFPAAAEIRQAAFDLKERAAGVPTAYEAWAEVLHACRHYGANNPPEFSHPLIVQATASVGGYRQLCYSTDHTADRARFIDAYDRLANRQRTEERTLPQIGAYVAKQLAGGNGSAPKTMASIADVTRKLRTGNE
jgi:hypothetical protein